MMKFKIGRFAEPKEKISVGLDVGSHAIKCVKLRFTKSGTELEDFVISEISDLSRSLIDLSQSFNIKSANISVSGPSTLIRYVNFPKMDAAELQQALKFEAQKHIPFPVAEVYLDGYILDPDLPDNKMLVLLAAVKKDLIADRLKLMESAGIKVLSVAIDSVALVNAYNYNYPTEKKEKQTVVALVNIGGSITNLNILEDGNPRLSRDIHIGGNAFTRKLGEIFTLEFAAAEKLKLEPDENRRDKVRAAMESMVSNLCLEIRTSFDFYESQSAVSVTRMLISGGSSQFGGIKDMMSASVGVPVEDWGPCKNITLGSGVDAGKFQNACSRLGVAVGLALIQQ